MGRYHDIHVLIWELSQLVMSWVLWLTHEHLHSVLLDLAPGQYPSAMCGTLRTPGDGKVAGPGSLFGLLHPNPDARHEARAVTDSTCPRCGSHGLIRSRESVSCLACSHVPNEGTAVAEERVQRRIAPNLGPRWTRAERDLWRGAV